VTNLQNKPSEICGLSSFLFHNRQGVSEGRTGAQSSGLTKGKEMDVTAKVLYNVLGWTIFPASCESGESQSGPLMNLDHPISHHIISVQNHTNALDTKS
jgi:hypothetical protein